MGTQNLVPFGPVTEIPECCAGVLALCQMWEYDGLRSHDRCGIFL